jgi:2-oxoglutarate dehydrogenase E2 component (dihydrolipoamide succinyltransferase)
MKFEVKIPSVGESINEVTIGQWLKNDGDYVEMDDVLCEIESEKATLEVRAEKEGVLKIMAKEGDTLSIGHKIAEIDTDARKTAAGEEKAEEKEASPQKPETKAGKEERDEVEKKSTLEKEEEKLEKLEEEAWEDEKTPEVSREKRARISPVASRLLIEAGLKPRDVQGSGSSGRITKTDAQRAIEESRKAGETVAPSKPLQEEVKPEPVKVAEMGPQKAEYTVRRRPAERIESRSKMSTLRKTIARRMVEAKNETAMLTTFNELDMSGMMAVRNKYKDLFQKKYDIKLGYMSFFVKACCIALKEFPRVNAMIDGDEIVYYDYCDISIAVSTPKGLVVPVIFDADRMVLAEIEKAVDHLAVKARDNKLTIEEMTGGTFSITNGGVFGSLLSTPIINVPQTAILGMHKIEERPIALNGEVVIRPMMYVALSYDHRLIDGKESVSFLVRLKELLEDPARMLLDV